MGLGHRRHALLRCVEFRGRLRFDATRRSSSSARESSRNIHGVNLRSRVRVRRRAYMAIMSVLSLEANHITIALTTTSMALLNVLLRARQRSF